MLKKYVCYNKNKSQNSLYIYYVILIKYLLKLFLLSNYCRQYNLIYPDCSL